MAVKKRIGIFGGTFDPIHLGHLIVAETIMDEFSLDRVVFIPAAVPPHKLGKDISAAHHRYMMTMLAICSNPRFEASDMEMRRTGPSYSRDTLAELIREHGEDTDFYFIVGADSVACRIWRRTAAVLAGWQRKFTAWKRLSWRFPPLISGKGCARGRQSVILFLKRWNNIFTRKDCIYKN